MLQNENDPIFTLSIKEFKNLMNNVMIDFVIKLPGHNGLGKERSVRSDMIYMYDVTELTGYTDKTVYTKVSRGEIPVVSTGRPLTFSRRQLNRWIHEGRPSVAEMKSNEFRFKSGTF